MTLHLWLMRHAKSDWDDPTLADHARPLSRRGRRAAARLGGWLVAEGAHPDEVIASDARRTRETWARVAAAARPLGTAALRLEPRLYLAPPETMAEVLGGAAGQVVLLIGHNPGIGALAARLVLAPPEGGEAAEVFARYPTGATAHIEFDAPNWAEAVRGRGRLVDFIWPRALGGAED
jgi:phosphohistidine phosphatase